MRASLSIYVVPALPIMTHDYLPISSRHSRAAVAGISQRTRCAVVRVCRSARRGQIDARALVCPGAGMRIADEGQAVRLLGGVPRGFRGIAVPGGAEGDA